MIHWTDYLKYLPMASQMWLGEQRKKHPYFVLLMSIFLFITLTNLILIIGLRLR